MSVIICLVTMAAAFVAALMLAYASFDLPISRPIASTAPQVRDGHDLRSIREMGLWGAILALIGAYLTAFLM